MFEEVIAEGDAMIRTILVPATGGDEDPGTFITAVQVARTLDSHLDFLHVRIDPAVLAAAFATGGGMVPAQMINDLEAEATQREDRVRTFVHEFCTCEGIQMSSANYQGVSAQWHREIGNGAWWISEYGRTSDLMVIGRPTKPGDAGRDTLETALLDTGRPLLIPGTIANTMETIAIAWKSTREAARAVTAASAFIARAKRVVIMMVDEGDRVNGQSGERLLASLRRHNPATEARHLQNGAGAADALLEAAAEIKTGLLVMGGYSHSRLRERVFGGVTARVLSDAGISVLMAH
jgi:nucleotide-binding universal stress UspA family protein